MTWLWTFTLAVPYCCADPPLALSKDGRYLALATDKLRFWDLSEAGPLWDFDFPGDGVWIEESALYMAISPDGVRVAVVTFNFEGSSPRLWVFTREGKLDWFTPLPGFYPMALTMSTDGTTLVVSLSKEILVFNTSNPHPLFTWSSGSALFGGNLQVSKDGRFFAETNAWNPGDDRLKLYYFSREEGLLWARDTGLGVVKASIDFTEDGSRVLTVDRKTGSLAAFDSSGREVLGLESRYPTSNGAFLDDERKFLLGTKNDLLLIDMERRTQQLIWRPDAPVRTAMLRHPFFAVVYASPEGGESVALGTFV